MAKQMFWVVLAEDGYSLRGEYVRGRREARKRAREFIEWHDTRWSAHGIAPATCKVFYVSPSRGSRCDPMTLIHEWRGPEDVTQTLVMKEVIKHPISSPA